MGHYGLRDDGFARIEAHLPEHTDTVGRSSEVDNCVFVEAVIWKIRSGGRWRDLLGSAVTGKLENTPNGFSRWAASGALGCLFKTLVKTLADDPDNAMTDATIVRAHQHSARAG
jgi:transposase